MTADDYDCERKWNWEKNRRKPLPTFGRDLSKSGRDLTILILIAIEISLAFDIILFNDQSYINNKPFGLVSMNISYLIVKYHKKSQKIILQYEGRRIFSWSLIYNIKNKTWSA